MKIIVLKYLINSQSFAMTILHKIKLKLCATSCTEKQIMVLQAFHLHPTVPLILIGLISIIFLLTLIAMVLN